MLSINIVMVSSVNAAPKSHSVLWLA